MLPAGWWSWFGSPELDEIVRRAFAGNPGVEAARARLRGAASTLAARRALRAPELLAQGSGSYGSQGVGGGGVGQGGGSSTGGGGTSPTVPDDGTPEGGGGTGQPGNPAGGGGAQDNGGGGGGPAIGGRSFAIYTASATVSYDFDLAGRNRRLIETAAAQVEARRQELQGAYLALAGNIVSTVLERAAVLRQIAEREALIRALEERLRLIRVQVEEGRTARATLVAAAVEVASLRATLPPLRAQAEAARHALAELVGVPLAEAPPADIVLERLRLPRSVPIALPSQLVRSRPDILAAEANLRAASATIGVEEADLYPDLTLDASFGVGGVGSSLGRFFDVGAGLIAPLFDGGRRRAERDVAVAAYQEALATYRQRVLAAFTEVANGVRLLETDAVALRDRTVALDAARESLDLAVFQAREGALTEIDVIVVQQQYRNAALAYVDALARRFQDTATLFAALGPGPIDDAGLQSVIAGEHVAATRASLKAGQAPETVPMR